MIQIFEFQVQRNILKDSDQSKVVFFPRHISQV
jgi:hypothetical protein